MDTSTAKVQNVAILDWLSSGLDPNGVLVGVGTKSARNDFMSATHIYSALDHSSRPAI